MIYCIEGFGKIDKDSNYTRSVVQVGCHVTITSLNTSSVVDVPFRKPFLAVGCLGYGDDNGGLFPRVWQNRSPESDRWGD